MWRKFNSEFSSENRKPTCYVTLFNGSAVLNSIQSQFFLSRKQLAKPNSSNSFSATDISVSLLFHSHCLTSTKGFTSRCENNVSSRSRSDRSSITFETDLIHLHISIESGVNLLRLTASSEKLDRVHHFAAFSRFMTRRSDIQCVYLNHTICDNWIRPVSKPWAEFFGNNEEFRWSMESDRD